MNHAQQIYETVQNSSKHFNIQLELNGREMCSLTITTIRVHQLPCEFPLQQIQPSEQALSKRQQLNIYHVSFGFLHYCHVWLRGIMYCVLEYTPFLNLPLEIVEEWHSSSTSTFGTRDKARWKLTSEIDSDSCLLVGEITSFTFLSSATWKTELFDGFPVPRVSYDTRSPN